MAIQPIKYPPSYNQPAGKSYADNYLRSKSQLLQTSMAWAEQELKAKYNSDLAYQKEMQALYAATEAELDALRKERATIEAAIAKIKGSSKEGKTEMDYRSDLIAERTKLAATIAEESTKVSAQRVDLITKAEGLFDVPLSASDAITRSVTSNSSRFNVPPGTTPESIVEDYLATDSGLATAFNGLTGEQKQAAALELYNKLRVELSKGKAGGQPLTLSEAQGIKGQISDAFGVDISDINADALAKAKKEKSDEYLAIAGTTRKQMEETIALIDSELASLDKAPTAGEAILSKIGVDPDTLMEQLLIDALKDDGKIDAEEEANAKRIIVDKVKSSLDEDGTITVGGKKYNEQEIDAILLDSIGIVDRQKGLLDNYLLQNQGDPITQSWIREGELRARKESLSQYQYPEQIAQPKWEDVTKRAAQIYAPQRTKEGYGILPYYSKERTAERRDTEAFVSPTTYPKEKGFAIGTIQSIQQGMKDGSFVPRELDEVSQTTYDNLSKSLREGALSPSELLSEITRLTTGAQGLYDNSAAAQKAREDIYYNILGDSYSSWKASKVPPAPSTIDIPEPSTTPWQDVIKKQKKYKTQPGMEDEVEGKTS